MATQHPDNASAPFWNDQPLVSSDIEMEEIYQLFFTVGCDEYMWDWEGKFADEAIIERLMTNHIDAFRKKQLGRDNFITLRVPNIWEEKTFKLARAYMSILSASEFIKSLGLHTPPVFELIFPMTKRADQLIHIQKTFQKTAKLHESIFGNTVFGEGYIHIIPIFESTDNLADCGNVIEEFLKLHREHFGAYPPYLRLFIARSDPALNAGIVPAVLASRMALREFYRIEKATGIPVYPIIGTGSLPFRGGINPENIKKSLPQYQSVKTLSIQSAFRYDYPLKEVKRALAYIKKHLADIKPIWFSDEEFKQLRKINDILKLFYKSTVEDFADLINDMARFVPSRRERMQHIGLFGYSRGLGKVSLPRAIKFTASCYSFGIPPEFIGTGRGLKEIKRRGLLPLVEKHFFTMRSELAHAGKFLNLENLEGFAKMHTWARDILEDVNLCEEILGLKLGPQKDRHFLHRNLTSNIVFKHKSGTDFTRDLVDAAVLRKSLG